MTRHKVLHGHGAVTLVNELPILRIGFGAIGHTTQHAVVLIERICGKLARIVEYAIHFVTCHGAHLAQNGKLLVNFSLGIVVHKAPLRTCQTRRSAVIWLPTAHDVVVTPIIAISGTGTGHDVEPCAGVTRFGVFGHIDFGRGVNGRYHRSVVVGALQIFQRLLVLYSVVIGLSGYGFHQPQLCVGIARSGVERLCFDHTCHIGQIRGLLRSLPRIVITRLDAVIGTALELGNLFELRTDGHAQAQPYAQ